MHPGLPVVSWQRVSVLFSGSIFRACRGEGSTHLPRRTFFCFVSFLLVSLSVTGVSGGSPVITASGRHRVISNPANRDHAGRRIWFCCCCSSEGKTRPGGGVR